MENFIRKNGLVYSKDLRTIIGVDGASSEFTGTIPYGAVAIEDEVFEDCPFLEFSISDSVLSLGAALFKDSKNLKKVKLPSGVTKLPPYLFSGCTALTKVVMPKTLESLPEGLFYNCASLPDVPFRAGIKELPENVLFGCSSLKSLVIPPSVKVIRKNAVAGCTNLMTVVLPESLVDLDDHAFDSCPSLRNIRINGDNRIFYVNESDGCLYERTAQGDRLKIKIAEIQNSTVSFFQENVDEEDDEFFSDEGLFEEEDSDFSATVSENEENDFENATENEIQLSVEEKETIMADSNVDDLLADIMGEEQERTASENVAITPDELENVFATASAEEQPEEKVEDDGTSGKTKILLDSVKLSKTITCEPEGEPPVDANLFVIAERTVTGADGQPAFTEKLESCVKKFAKAQDFKRIFLLYGLPTDNDEFMQFYYHYMSGRNVVFATEAASPSKLSEYGKAVCENSRISLDREDLIHQRKKISIKNSNLVKLVIQDLYD